MNTNECNAYMLLICKFLPKYSVKMIAYLCMQMSRVGDRMLFTFYWYLHGSLCGNHLHFFGYLSSLYIMVVVNGVYYHFPRILFIGF